MHLVAGHHIEMDHGGGVVAGVFTPTGWISHDGGTQGIVRIRVGTAHTFIHHRLDVDVGVPLHLHADFDEHCYDTGILTDGPMSLRTHARIDQDLCQRIPRRWRLFLQVSLMHRLDKVERVVIRDVLQCICNAIDKVVLFYNRHGD
jgi:hypothetical protein